MQSIDLTETYGHGASKVIWYNKTVQKCLTLITLQKKA